MERALTNSQMHAADEYIIKILGVPSETLMQRAGVALADVVEKKAREINARSVLIVCGTGNNGGDGYVCANELLTRGISVKVYAFDGKLSPDCTREKERYKGGYSAHISGAIIVDCIFGTGLCREVSGVYAEIIKAINSSGAFVISADIASGLNGDNGLITGTAVKADLTVAIAEYKVGHFLNDGLDHSGEIIKKDIGITCPDDKYACVNYKCVFGNYFSARRRNTHKGSYGTANIVAGSEKYVGAAVLSIEAMLKSGCGYVKLTTCEKLKYSLVSKYPQVIFTDGIDLNADCIAIGMGCGVSEELYKKIELLLCNYSGKLLIDADGINSLAKYGVAILKEAKCEVLITPHIKEFSRLSGLTIDAILNDPVLSAKSFASKYGVKILLKSSASVISDGQSAYINIRGTTALSKGGSGDILSGFICGSIARGLSVIDGALCGAETLGIAAEISSKQKTDYCATAKDIIKNLHFSVKHLTEQL